MFQHAVSLFPNKRISYYKRARREYAPLNQVIERKRARYAICNVNGNGGYRPRNNKCIECSDFVRAKVVRIYQNELRDSYPVLCCTKCHKDTQSCDFCGTTKRSASVRRVGDWVCSISCNMCIEADNNRCKCDQYWR
jgi:hypothetical protein